jgi:Holliday junction resolvase RusA-like endonuclease
MLRFTISGKIPSKKDQLKPRGRGIHGKGFYNPQTGRIRAIEQEIVYQLGNYEPIDKPTITMDFICSSGRSDLDNKVTTILDCMVKSGILVNDNLEHLPGPITFQGRKGNVDIVEVTLCSPSS